MDTELDELVDDLSTMIAYRDVLTQPWLLDPVAASLLEPAGGRPGVPRAQVLGALLESLVTLCVRVYAQHSMATVGHLRTRNGDHEVDLIVQGRRRRVVAIMAIEVKLSPTVEDRDVRHLRWLGAHLGNDPLDAMVVTTGRSAYRRRDGIAVVPAAMLGP